VEAQSIKDLESERNDFEVAQELPEARLKDGSTELVASFKVR
jgi:hypothetical protein